MPRTAYHYDAWTGATWNQQVPNEAGTNKRTAHVCANCGGEIDGYYPSKEIFNVNQKRYLVCKHCHDLEEEVI